MAFKYASLGCTEDDDAKRYLLMYDNDLNRAIDRFFNQKNRNLTASQSSHQEVQRNGNNGDVEVVEAMDTNEPGPSSRRIHRAPIMNNRHGVNAYPYVLLILIFYNNYLFSVIV